MSWATRFKSSMTNQNQGGGNKKEGLPPSVGTGNLNVWNGMRRAYGTPKDRALQVCINQLGSVNPRVYQTRYCGKITSNGGGETIRECDPQFTLETNQWTQEQDTDIGKYDICFVLDKSSSMNSGPNNQGNPQPGGRKWDLLLRFIRIFHNLILNQSVETGNSTYKLQGNSLLHAPAHIPVDSNGHPDPLECNYADPSYRVSLLTFSSGTEINLTYNTYVSQIFEPEEEGQDPPPGSEIQAPNKVFPITEKRLNQILEPLGPNGLTNGGNATSVMLNYHAVHQEFAGVSYVGPQGNYDPETDSGDKNTRCGNYIQRLNNKFIGQGVCGNFTNNLGSCITYDGKIPGDVVTTITNNNLGNGQTRTPAKDVAIPGQSSSPPDFENYPNNFSDVQTGGIYQEAVVQGTTLLSLPPYLYSNTLNGSIYAGYRNGWRNLNTIFIWVTDGQITTSVPGPNFATAISQLNTFENNLQCNSIFSNCLTRIGIGFGSGAAQDELEAFAGITTANIPGVVTTEDEYHRVINQANLSNAAMTQLAEDVLSSVTNFSFTQTTSPEYQVLSLNRGVSCPYTDEQFINEIIPLIKDVILPAPNGNGEKLSTLDLTGQILLSNVTLQALIAIPGFKENIKTLILSGCSNMSNAIDNGVIDSLITILNGDPNDADNGLINLDLSFTGINSAGISTLVTNSNGNGIQTSQTLKYLNIDGIAFPNSGNNPANLNSVMSGLSQNTSLECLSMQLCQLDNNMLDDVNNLKKLIETTTSQSKLIHIHLDQNNMDFNEIQAFVTNQPPGNGFVIGNKIPSLTRVFIQFQKKLSQLESTGSLPNPPPNPPTSVWVQEQLLSVNGNNSVTSGQFTTQQVQAINGVASLINGNSIPVFVVNGYTQANIFQAWVEIPLGSGLFYEGGNYPITHLPTDPWYEPGVFNHNNPNVVLGRVVYP